MHKRPSGLQALTILLISVVPVIGICIAYFVVYVRSEEAYITQRNYRALATVGRQVTGRLTALRVALDTTALTCVQDKATRCFDDLAATPHLTLAACAADEPRGVARLTADANGLPVLRMSAAPRPLCANVALQPIFDEQLQLGDIFDDIILAEPDGRVIYHQREQDNGRISTLQSLLDAAKPAVTPGTAPAPEKSHWPRGVALNDAVPTQYLGENYLMFFQPVDASQTASGEWLLSGFVSADRFAAETRQISPTLLMAGLFVAGLVFLSWPLLKLWNLGPRERLDAADLHVLAIACVLASGLLSVFLLGSYTYRSLSQRFDDELQRFAGSLEHHFLEEVSRAYDVVSILGRLTAATPDAAPDAVATLIEGQPVEYPYFSDLVWVDNNGKPRKRWTPRRIAGEEGTLLARLTAGATPDLALQDRQYFRDAQAGRLWRLHPSGTSEVDCAAELVQSRTNGQTTFVVAIPLSKPGGGKSPDVALITTRLLSMIRPVVPPGFGFAVINPDGLVLLAADARRNLAENLFQECDDDRRLRAAVDARRAEHLDVRYYGEGHRFYVLPLRDTPWTVVVFRNKSTLRSLSLGLSVVWAVMFALYVAGYLIAALVANLLWRGYRADWLWPQRALSPSYAIATGLLLLITAVGFGSVDRDDTLAALTTLVTVPVLAVAIVYRLLTASRPAGGTGARRAVAGLAVLAGVALLAVAGGADDHGRSVTAILLTAVAVGLAFALNHRLRGQPPPRESRFRVAYVAMLFSLLVAIAVAPAVLLYGDVLEQGMTGFVRWGQTDILRAQLERAGRLQPYFSKPDTPPGAWRARLLEQLDVYFSTLFGSTNAAAEMSTANESSACGPEIARPALGSIAARLRAGEERLSAGIGAVTPRRSYLSGLFLPLFPAFETVIGRLAEMVPDCASDRGWTWTMRADPRMQLTLNDARLRTMLGGGEDRPFQVSADLVLFPTPTRPGWWLGALMLLLAWAGLQFAVLWSITRRVFVLDADGTGEVNVSAQRPPQLGLWLFQRPAPAGLTRTDTCVLNLREESGPTTVAGMADRAEAASSSVIVIDHLEHHWGDPQWDDAKLALLERLLCRSDATIILLSEIDPAAHFAARMAEAAPPAPEGKDTDTSTAKRFSQWTDALRGFSTRCIFPPADAPAPGEAQAVIGEPLAAALTRKGVAGRREEWSEARYWAIWSQCTRSEKLALIQLAREGLLNPNNLSVVRRLMQRQLILRAPSFRLMHDGFRRFVLGAETSATVKEWETEGGWGGWSRLRTPLLILLIFAAVFVYITQRGVFDTTVGVATALAGALPIVLRLVGMFGQGGGAPSEK